MNRFSVICVIVVMVLLKTAAPQKGTAVSSFKPLRDPFALPQQKEETKRKRGVQLEGIVQAGPKYCAVLACGGKRAVVEQGTTFEGYTLLAIGNNFVVIGRGDAQKRLTLE